jgi:hypothetical protein
MALMLAVACAASPAKVTRPWRVQFLTDGGLAGRGVGNITLTSDGKLELTTMTRKSCAYDATSEELAKIETLLANARPSEWGSYVPESRCCDRVEYRLTFGPHTAIWIDDPLPLPEDVVKLSEALAELRHKYTTECLKP